MQIGFMVIDALARAEGIDVKKLERSAAVGKGEIAGKKVLLVKPVTFMNNSGESVGALARFYKVRQRTTAASVRGSAAAAALQRAACMQGCFMWAGMQVH